MAFNRSFPIVDSHNELHEKDILWTEENLQTSNAFGAENTVETLEPPKKRSRAVSVPSLRISDRWLICAMALSLSFIS